MKILSKLVVSQLQFISHKGITALTFIIIITHWQRPVTITRTTGNCLLKQHFTFTALLQGRGFNQLGLCRDEFVFFINCREHYHKSDKVHHL
jgi:hypothetical protein